MANDQRGMVTAELALGILSEGLAVVFACWCVGLVVLQGRCDQAAGQVARQLARGDQAAADQARRRAPQDAKVRVQRGSTTVSVTVEVSSSLGAIGPVRLSGRAVADLEPGLAP